MVIIHTADWHIGKRTSIVSRLEDQRRVLDEICDIAARENADLVLVAGDIFDTPTPSAEAEQLFYKAALKISSICPLVILSGNHDDPQRLGAPSGIAGACGIYIIDGLDNKINTETVQGGYGYIRMKIKDTTLNLAAIPYMSMARLSALKLEGENYTEQIKTLIDKVCAEAFSSQGVNIFASHLFMSGSENGDERELGTALQLPSSILPEGAVYNALGHVHKPQTVSKSRNAYYSGSILQYHFDDKDDKRVIKIKIDDDNALPEITSIPLTEGRRLKRERVNSFEQACKALSDPNVLVELIYTGGEPLSGREISGLKVLPSFCKITVERQKNDSEKEHELKAGGKLKTDSELFRAFYLQEVGKEPDEETVNMFLTVLRGEEL